MFKCYRLLSCLEKYNDYIVMTFISLVTAVYEYNLAGIAVIWDSFLCVVYNHL